MSRELNMGTFKGFPDVDSVISPNTLIGQALRDNLVKARFNIKGVDLIPPPQNSIAYSIDAGRLKIKSLVQYAAGNLVSGLRFRLNDTIKRHVVLGARIITGATIGSTAITCLGGVAQNGAFLGNSNNFAFRGSSPIEPNKIYYVEVHYDKTTNTVKGYVNGEFIAQKTMIFGVNTSIGIGGTSLLQTTGTPPNLLTGNNNHHYFIDDVYLLESDEEEVTPLGPVIVKNFEIDTVTGPNWLSSEVSADLKSTLTEPMLKEREPFLLSDALGGDLVVKFKPPEETLPILGFKVESSVWRAPEENVKAVMSVNDELTAFPPMTITPTADEAANALTLIGVSGEKTSNDQLITPAYLGSLELKLKGIKI